MHENTVSYDATTWQCNAVQKDNALLEHRVVHCVQMRCNTIHKRRYMGSAVRGHRAMHYNRWAEQHSIKGSPLPGHCHALCSNRAT
jgi:hypothetical protein